MLSAKKLKQKIVSLEKSEKFHMKEYHAAVKRDDQNSEEQRKYHINRSSEIVAEINRSETALEKQIVVEEKERLQVKLNKIDEGREKRNLEIKKQKQGHKNSMELAKYKHNLSVKPQASKIPAIRAQMEADLLKYKAQLLGEHKLRELDHDNTLELKSIEADLDAQLHVFKSKVDTQASKIITTHGTNERIREALALHGIKGEQREHELSIAIKLEYIKHLIGKDRDTHQANLKSRNSISGEDKISQIVTAMIKNPERYKI